MARPPRNPRKLLALDAVFDAFLEDLRGNAGGVLSSRARVYAARLVETAAFETASRESAPDTVRLIMIAVDLESIATRIATEKRH